MFIFWYYWSSEACSKLKGWPSIFGSKWSVNSGDSQDTSSVTLLELIGDVSSAIETVPFLVEFDIDSFIFFFFGFSRKFTAVRQNLSGGSLVPWLLLGVGRGILFLELASYSRIFVNIIHIILEMTCDMTCLAGGALTCFSAICNALRRTSSASMVLLRAWWDNNLASHARSVTYLEITPVPNLYFLFCYFYTCSCILASVEWLLVPIPQCPYSLW